MFSGGHAKRAPLFYRRAGTRRFLLTKEGLTAETDSLSRVRAGQRENMLKMDAQYTPGLWNYCFDYGNVLIRFNYSNNLPFTAYITA